ncbi:hypothetical protein [Breoghania sp.]|uniref:hypothetical protein n=1 Tax=Breoghania sp. TaxID=2065378 RepID=UPI002612CFE9|nr:hypothetical protein [Breoghania sp.]MDJ0933604.1 hypothetical protein [Breoghania sp.]
MDECAPDLRCAVFPLDKSAYSLLLEGDPLHHASVDRACIDPLDPMDSFFDVLVQNAVTVRRRRPSRVAKAPDDDSGH